MAFLFKKNCSFERIDKRTDKSTNEQTDGRSNFIAPQILFGGIKIGNGILWFVLIPFGIFRQNLELFLPFPIWNGSFYRSLRYAWKSPVLILSPAELSKLLWNNSDIQMFYSVVHFSNATYFSLDSYVMAQTCDHFLRLKREICLKKEGDFLSKREICAWLKILPFPS